MYVFLNLTPLETSQVRLTSCSQSLLSPRSCQVSVTLSFSYNLSLSDIHVIGCLHNIQYHHLGNLTQFCFLDSLNGKNILDSPLICFAYISYLEAFLQLSGN